MSKSPLSPQAMLELPPPETVAPSPESAPAQAPAPEAELRGMGLWGTKDFDPALQMAVFWYVQDVYGRLGRLTDTEMRRVADAAGDAICTYPCWMRDEHGQFPEFDLPHLGKKSSVYVIAVAVAILVWEQCHLANNPLPDSPLLAVGLDGLKLWRQLHDVAPAWQAGGHPNSEPADGAAADNSPDMAAHKTAAAPEAPGTWPGTGLVVSVAPTEVASAVDGAPDA